MMFHSLLFEMNAKSFEKFFRVSHFAQAVQVFFLLRPFRCGPICHSDYRVEALHCRLGRLSIQTSILPKQGDFLPSICIFFDRVHVKANATFRYHPDQREREDSFVSFHRPSERILLIFLLHTCVEVVPVRKGSKSNTNFLPFFQKQDW